MKYIKRNQIEKNTLQNGRVFFYAQDRSRTYKPLRALAPEASVFAISPPGQDDAKCTTSSIQVSR